MSDVPIGVKFLDGGGSRHSKDFIYKFSVLSLTYLSYTAYHASRKPISIVKNAKASVRGGLVQLEPSEG